MVYLHGKEWWGAVWKREREVLQLRMFALFGAKNLGFFEMYSMSARKKGVGPVQTRVRDQFFAILCQRLLWTAPSLISLLSFVLFFENVKATKVHHIDSP